MKMIAMVQNENSTSSMERAFASLTREDLERELRTVKQELNSAYVCAKTDAYIRQYYEAKFAGYDAEYIKLFIDANGLKKINDTKGHEEGDLYLKNISAVAKQHTREEDLLIRWGGDEFILFVKTTDITVVQSIKERIDKALTENRLSAAIGIGNTVKEADKNMYEDKRRKKSPITKLKANFIKLVQAYAK